MDIFHCAGFSVTYNWILAVRYALCVTQPLFRSLSATFRDTARAVIVSHPRFLQQANVVALLHSCIWHSKRLLLFQPHIVWVGS